MWNWMGSYPTVGMGWGSSPSGLDGGTTPYSWNWMGYTPPPSVLDGGNPKWTDRRTRVKTLLYITLYAGGNITLRR